MTDRELWLAISGIVATVATAAFGLYFTHKARTAAFRELLYTRQLDAVARILGAYSQLRDEMTVLFGPHRDISAHDTVWQRVREFADRFASLAPEASTFLPDVLVVRYLAMHDDAIDMLRRIAYDNLPQSELDRFQAHGLDFANVARAHLGTDALSAETRRLFIQPGSSGALTRLPQRAPDGV